MLTITDSVSIKLLGREQLLSSVGNELFYYFIKDGQTLKKNCNVKIRDKIHGIISFKIGCDDLVISYGGREFVTLFIRQNQIEIYEKYEINDWINSMTFYINKEGCSGSLLTSHNVAQYFIVNLKNKSIDFKKKAWSEDSSTLYCSKIVGSCWDSTVVFAGTALGDILIWKPKSGEDKNHRGPIIYRLNGHKGVIFSIDVNLHFKLISTTSDDRSVRFWNIENISENWINCSFKSNISVFGHTARVFKSRIIIEENQPYIATVGEDSYFCLFDFNGLLKCKKKLYSGAVIWDIEYDPKTKTIFTCGSDGNIEKFCIKEILETKNNIKEDLSLKTITKEYISKIKFMECGIIIGLTNFNKLLFKNKGDWKQIDLPAYKCCVLETYENKIITAGYCNITIYEINDEEILVKYQKEIKNNMIRSFHNIGLNEYILSDENGNCYILSEDLKSSINFEIPYCRERWTTFALKVEQFLLIADRCSNLHLYEMSSEKNIILKYTLKNVHGSLGITNLKVKEKNDLFILMQSSGHDGFLREIEINKIKCKLIITKTKKIDIIWIDKIYEYKNNLTTKQLYVGFNDNHFIASDEENGIIFEYDCGGGHRYWDLHIDEVNFNCSFAFVRRKNLHQIKFSIKNNSENLLIIPKTSWHVKSCNALNTFLMNKNNLYIASGGDDNILKFSQIQLNQIIHLHDMTMHISSIRSISVYKINDNEILIISSGGRAQICITKLQIYNDNFTMREVCNYMLKSSDYERKRLGQSQKIDFDPETRFMCMDILNSDKDGILCFVGCSDGFIRTFSVVANDEFYSLFALESIFYGRCILNIHVMFVCNEFILLTMSTDGKICFWNINNLDFNSKPFFIIDHHDSGINCFDIQKNDEIYKIVTGGDDQKIVLSTIKFNFRGNKISVELLAKIKSVSIHTAQVTGIKFYNDYLYTTGVDQMIYLINVNDLTINTYRYSCVADIKGLNLITNKINNENNVVVYGSGIQIF